MSLDKVLKQKHKQEDDTASISISLQAPTTPVINGMGLSQVHDSPPWRVHAFKAIHREKYRCASM